jgi:hypothetical protein
VCPNQAAGRGMVRQVATTTSSVGDRQASGAHNVLS